jgi:DNA-binding NarL/FixJ family response regulator
MHYCNTWGVQNRVEVSTAMRVLLEERSEVAARSEVLPQCNLTRREREVVALVGLGLSNCEIARELVIAPSTAERHVANILQKLSMRPRAQIVAWRARRLSLTPNTRPRGLDTRVRLCAFTGQSRPPVTTS